MQEVAPGRTIGGRYTLEERRLASADGVEAWSATDTAMHAEVTLTLFPATAPTAPAILDAARRAAHVQDPRLVRILDVGTSGHLSWIVEEHHAGAGTLVDIVENSPLSGEDARTVVGEAASCLAAAGRRGLHHLQLTPYSVLITRTGEVKIGGLGTVRALEGGEEPPVDRAERLDTLGPLAVGYYALTTRWPLPTKVPGLLPAPRIGGGVPAPAEIAAGVPRDLDRLCRLVLNGQGGPSCPEQLADQMSPWRPTLRRRPRGAAAREMWAGASAGPPRDVHTPDAANLPVLTPRPVVPAVPATPYAAREEQPLPVAGTATEPTRTRALAHRVAASAGGVTDRLGGLARAATGTGRRTTQRVRTRAGTHRAVRDPGNLPAVLFADVSDDAGRESPGPLLRRLDPDERPGAHSSLVLASVAAFVTLALVAALVVIYRGFDHTSQHAAPAAATSPATAASAAPDSPSTMNSAGPAPVVGTPIGIVRGTSIDPVGQDGENDSRIPRAYDGNPATTWQSELYHADPRWNGTASKGVALAFRLARPTTVRTVRLTFPSSPGQSGAIYVGLQPSLSGATKAAEFAEATGTTELQLSGGAQASYVIVWFTKAPRDGAGYRASLAEIVPLG